MTAADWPADVIDWTDVSTRLHARRNVLVATGASPADLAVIDGHIDHVDRRLLEMTPYDRGPAPRH